MKISQKPLKRIRGDILSVLPEITGLIEDFQEIDKERGDTQEDSLSLLRSTIYLLLEKRYEGLVKILAVLYEQPYAEMEDKTVGEIVEMVADTLDDRELLRFFPQLGRWGRRTPSAT